MAELEARLDAGGRPPLGLRGRGRARRARRRRQAAAAAALLPRLAGERRRAAARGGRRGRARAHGDARPRRPRRRRADAPRRARGLVGLRPGRRARAPATTSSRARSASSRRPATPPRSPCSPTRASASRAARRSSARQTHDPDTAIEAYLERCALKTGKLFEAACLLGSGGDRRSASTGSRSGSRSRSPTTSSTAPARRRRPARSPAPTCARGRRRCRCCYAAAADETVRAALAGGPLDGALVRVGDDRRARALARGGPRLRVEGPLAPRRASRTARSSKRSPTPSWTGRAEWRSPSTGPLDAIREKVEAGERLDLEDGLTLLESDDLLALGELADLARRVARRRRPRLLRPEPLPLPDERLPREVQVLRVRGDAEAGARVHDRARRVRRRRARAARADRVHRDPHGQRREPARRLRVLRRHDRASSTRRCRTCSSSATRPPRSTT